MKEISKYSRVKEKCDGREKILGGARTSLGDNKTVHFFLYFIILDFTFLPFFLELRGQGLLISRCLLLLCVIQLFRH